MTATIKVTLNPGLWGDRTAEDSKGPIWKKAYDSPCKTSLTVVDNTHINVQAKGRTREVEALAREIRFNCLINITAVEIENDKGVTKAITLL